MTLKYEPWGEEPVFEWDEWNEEEIWNHGVTCYEIEDCFAGDHAVRPHKKARSEPEKYADRYSVNGFTSAGRALFIVVQHKGGSLIRTITAWDDN